MDPYNPPHAQQRPRPQPSVLPLQPPPPSQPVLCYCRVHGTLGTLSQQQQQLVLQQQQQQRQLSRLQQEQLLAFHRRAAGAEREILGGGGGGEARRTHHQHPSSEIKKAAPSSQHQQRPQYRNSPSASSSAHHRQQPRQGRDDKSEVADRAPPSTHPHLSAFPPPPLPFRQQPVAHHPQTQEQSLPSSLVFHPAYQRLTLTEGSQSLARTKRTTAAVDPQPQPRQRRHHHNHHEHDPSCYKSAPSSPVSTQHHHSHSNHHPHHGSRSRYNAAVMAAVAQAQHAKKGASSANSSKAGDLEAPNFIVVGGDGSADDDILPSPVIERSVYAGCCGRELPSLRRTRAGRGLLGGSYSALDASSDEVGSQDSSGCGDAVTSSSHHPHKSVSDCVKNIVHWVSAVGDKVNRGTAALLDSIPANVLPGKEDHHVVMVGLDSAGKTTVLYRLKFDQYVSTVPTIGFNCEKVRVALPSATAAAGDDASSGGHHHRALTFLVWDVGGQEKVRPLWRPYTRATDAIVFVVDSCDVDKLEEAKLELHRIMRTPDNASVPLLVIANKQDLPGAKSPSSLERLLQLSELKQLWHLEPVCAVTGEGLDSGLEKIHELILKRKKMTKRARNKTR